MGDNLIPAVMHACSLAGEGLIRRDPAVSRIQPSPSGFSIGVMMSHFVEKRKRNWDADLNWNFQLPSLESISQIQIRDPPPSLILVGFCKKKTHWFPRSEFE